MASWLLMSWLALHRREDLATHRRNHWSNLYMPLQRHQRQGFWPPCLRQHQLKLTDRRRPIQQHGVDQEEQHRDGEDEPERLQINVLRRSPPMGLPGHFPAKPAAQLADHPAAARRGRVAISASSDPADPGCIWSMCPPAILMNRSAADSWRAQLSSTR